VMVLSLVLALCPCLTCAQMAADDCCASDGPSVGAACCTQEGASGTAVPSPTVLVAASLSAVAQPMAIDAALPASIHGLKVPTRPVVARAILRI